MGTSLVIGPTLEPVSLAEVKAHLRVEVPDDDAVIASLIIAARSHVEGVTRRVLMTQTWDVTYDWDWPWRKYRAVLRLPFAPVQSVVSVSYVDEAGATQVLSTSPALYVAVLNNSHPRIEQAYEVEWPVVRNQPQAITVRAVYGYGDAQSDVPPELRHALKLLVAHWYENREAATTGVTAVELPMAVESLLSGYRRGFG